VATTEQVVKIRAAFGGTKALAFSPDGHWLATADGDTSIRMYDARTGRLRNTVDDLLLESFAIVFSTDGRCILTGGADKVINVIDASNGKLLRLPSKMTCSSIFASHAMVNVSQQLTSMPTIRVSLLR